MVSAVSVLVRIAYDGTDFSGWARQAPRPDGRPIRTVQGELERVLGDLFDTPVPVRGASRTDAGVHAQGQLVAFEPPGAVPVAGIHKVLRDRLPRDVAALAAWEEAGEVDVRGGNLGKHYRYAIRCTTVPDPVLGRTQWWLQRRLDLDAMREAASAFEGAHDFATFRAAHCQAASTVRTMESVTVRSEPARVGPQHDPGRTKDEADDVVVVDVVGQAFLYNMVRIMVGTLVEVGLGRRPPRWVEGLLATVAPRGEAGPTAPACGLTLVEVRWDGGALARPRGPHTSQGH